MKRLLKLCLLLLVGAIVNVAVAWSVPLLDPTTNSFDHMDVSQEQLARSWRSITGNNAAPQSLTGRLLGNATSRILYIESDEPDDVGVGVMCKGWPLISVYGGFDVGTETTRGLMIWDSDQLSLELSMQTSGSAVVMPLLPEFPGFAINTIFYAAILLVVFFVPGMVKRGLRRRRGLCPACAYPIGSSPVCTECGKSLADFR